MRHPTPIWASDRGGTKIGPRRTHCEKVEQARAIRAVVGTASVIYAIRFPTGMVKIGCTRNLATRLQYFSSWRGVLVGVGPGDEEAERQVHNKLRMHLALGREYYHPHPEVLAVVNEMRQRWGLPHLAA